MAFHVGQRVKCINTRRWPRDLLGRRAILPKKGAIYTVRDIVPKEAFRPGTYEEPAEDGLHLVEVINPPIVDRLPGCARTTELAFRVSRFCPVRTTNIDVFTAMLAPAPKEPAELVDA